MNKILLFTISQLLSSMFMVAGDMEFKIDEYMNADVSV